MSFENGSTRESCREGTVRYLDGGGGSTKLHTR